MIIQSKLVVILNLMKKKFSLNKLTYSEVKSELSIFQTESNNFSHLKSCRAHLTNILPSFHLVPAGSDEDLLSTETDIENSLAAAHSDSNLQSKVSTDPSTNLDLPCKY